jgi:hypothetical protein
VLLLLLPIGVFAAPKTADEAKQLTVDWLKRDPRPFGATLGQRVKEVQTFNDDKGEPMYQVVYLDPSGFVIVPADDLVEPIIAFVSQGRFDPSTNNPLGALISADVPARVSHARALPTSAPVGRYLKARNKWQNLQQNSDTNTAPAPSLSNVSDLRVAPFVQTLWNQGTANNGLACFNYYTPPYAVGTSSNYPCGCVATALAQLLGYFQYPKTGVGTNSFTISIDGTNTTARLRGGDGAGGPYSWSNMPANPNNPTVVQCQAIGALMYDAAVSEQMGFAADGSGAGVNQPQIALLQTFMYGNAIFGSPANASEFDPSLVAMVNANLDARLPVCVALNGHQVVSDGYGYNLSTLYNHINMGWGGYDNAWYALPVVQTYTNLWGFIYNIYTNGAGEIISGRITSGGIPVLNATVTAYRVGGGTYTAATDTNGIYALVGVPSASEYEITVDSLYFISPFTNCSTGTSINGGSSSGNVWGEDFSLVPWIWPPLIMIQPANQLTNVGSTVTFGVITLSRNPMSYQWQVQAGGGSINWNNLNDGAFYSGSRNSNLVVNVLSVAMNGFQFRCIVTNTSGSVTSSFAQLTAVGFSPNCGVAAPAGLISWWTGDVTPNDAVGTNHGTLQSGATYTPGEVGYAFNFDGVSQFVNVPDAASLEITGPITIGAWIKTKTSNVQQSIVEKYGTPVGGGYALRETSSNKAEFFTLDNGYTGDFISGITSLTSNTWYHITGLWNGSNIQVYVNGVLDGTANSTRNPKAGSTPLKIGARGDDATTPFAGQIDEAVIFNRALSASEIQAIYQAGTNGMCAPTPLMFTGSPSYNKTNGIVLNASLRSSQSYHIQANTNLATTNWTTLTNFTAGTAPIFHFTNKAATNIPRQFYRIVSP